MFGEEQRVTATRILVLLEKQGFKCALSGRTLTPETASLDHVVPLGRGGKHVMGNVWIVEHSINRAKNSMSTPDFVAMCREVVAHQDAALVAPAAPAPSQG